MSERVTRFRELVARGFAAAAVARVMKITARRAFRFFSHLPPRNQEFKALRQLLFELAFYEVGDRECC